MVVNRKRRTISLPFEVDDKLVKQAQKEHRTITNLIEKLIYEYLEKIEGRN